MESDGQDGWLLVIQEADKEQEAYLETSEMSHDYYRERGMNLRFNNPSTTGDPATVNLQQVSTGLFWSAATYGHSYTMKRPEKTTFSYGMFLSVYVGVCVCLRAYNEPQNAFVQLKLSSFH